MEEHIRFTLNNLKQTTTHISTGLQYTLFDPAEIMAFM